MIPFCVSYIENDAKSIDNNAIWLVVLRINVDLAIF